MNSGPRRRNFEVQPVDRPGGAFARQEDIAAIWRVLHNVQVGNQRGICNRDSLRVPGAESDSTATSWRAWYNGGLIYLRIGPEQVTDSTSSRYPVSLIPTSPWSSWAYTDNETTVAVDASGWTANADGSDVYLFFQVHTGRAFIDTTFGRGIALPTGPFSLGHQYHRADGWRALRIGTLYNSGGMSLVPAYPQTFAYAVGLAGRLRVQGRRVVVWANNHGPLAFETYPTGSAWAPLDVELPLNSSGELYYVEDTPPPQQAGHLTLTQTDICVGYYVTDGVGLLYLWEVPMANLQPLP